MQGKKVPVWQGDKIIFEIVGVKNVLKYQISGEEVEIIMYETSTGIDFVKVRTEKGQLGIHTEYAWANYTYPGFEREIQSLNYLKINESVLPCDIIRFSNNETGEKKDIYFEISDFFGKYE
jgi:hypothetical protein